MYPVKEPTFRLWGKSDWPFEIGNFTYKLCNCLNNKGTSFFINIRELKPYHERQPDAYDTPQPHQPVELPQPDVTPQNNN